MKCSFPIPLKAVKAMKKLPFILGILLLTSCTAVQQVDVPLFIQGGTLKVFLTGFSQRATQAILSDVDHVQFDLEVSQAGTQTKTLTAAQLYDGGASAYVLFTNLYPRAATLSVTAFNSTNNALGSTSATASIQSGVETAVPITLQLN